jgi:hypothetical protein
MPDDSSDNVAAALSSVLTAGESIVAVAEQNVINSPFKKDTAVVTTRRFMIYRPKLFGRMELQDFIWQDVTDIQVGTSLLGAEITISAKRREPDGTVRAKNGKVDGLDKQAALRVYAAAQQFEEEWREKNRVRQMEEERARSGGVYLHGPTGPHAGSGTGVSQVASVEQRLLKLRELHEKHLITDAEYESRKTQIISEL